MAEEPPAPTRQSARSPDQTRFSPFGRKPLRTFALAIALPAFLLYVVSAGLVIATLVSMAQEIDRLEQQRGVTVMNAALRSFLNGLSDAVADEGAWNDAYLNVIVKPDPAWMDSTWGTTARLAATYDEVLVTDQAGKILFGENTVGAVSGMVADRFPIAGKLLTDLDAAIASSGDAATVVDFGYDGHDTLGLAAISIHRTVTGEMTVPRHMRRVLWIAKRITPQTLQDFVVRYQAPLATLSTERDPRASIYALADSAGNVTGTLSWISDRPGDEASRNALIVSTLVFFGIGIMLAAGLGAVRRAMLKRATQIEAAFAEQVEAVAAATAAAAAPVIVQAVATPAEEEEVRSAALEGINAADFAIEYRPIFDLRSETLIGVDALLRWTRPDKSQLLQEDLDAPDLATLMDRAGIIALRHATGELGPLFGVTLSLAITPQQLESSAFVEKITGTLGATSFQARRLQLAVSASAFAGSDAVRASIADLRRFGVTIALADFTPSPATLDVLRADLVDRICLTPGLVNGIDADPIRMRLAEVAIEAAQSTSVAITVTGVARKEEAARLVRLGCRDFSGPLFARAMSVAALTSLILAPARPRPVRQAG